MNAASCGMSFRNTFTLAVILDRSARVIIKSVVVDGESYRTPLQVSLLSDKQGQVTSLIVEQLAESGIKLVASLPDEWIAPLIHAVDKDDRFTHVPVNREESAIGLCSAIRRSIRSIVKPQEL
jgi:hypothetical protein